MKRVISILFTFFFLFPFTESINASWYHIRQVNGHRSWHHLDYDQFDTHVKMNGLLYETTIHFKAKLGNYQRWNWTSDTYTCQEPYPGDYRWQWVFNFPTESYITRFELWDANSETFITAHPVDITTGESLYDPQSNQYPHVLLRQYRNRNYNGHWDQFYHLTIEPVDRFQTVEFKLTYLSPAKAIWDNRLFEIRSKQLYEPYRDNCVEQVPAVFYFEDLQNPEIAPKTVDRFYLKWSKINNYFQAKTNKDGDYFYSPILLKAKSEEKDGTFLQTVQEDGLSFFQLSTKPMIQPVDVQPRHIVLCLDLIDRNIRRSQIEKIQSALANPPFAQDSIWVLTSDFVVRSLDDRFHPCSREHILNKLDEALKIVPELNTLPFMLKKAVQILNENKISGEIWLISNDSKHGYPAERANDILNQTLGAAEVPVQFRILDFARYPNYHYIRNKSYRGNEYLYENLFRLTDGTFYKSWEFNEYDWPEVALDCFAPKIRTVEIDPVPTAGLSFSRIDLNRGRQSFHERSRYFQIGLFEGKTPFEIRYFGQFQGDLYHKKIPLVGSGIYIGKGYRDWIKTYWYGDYIFNHLLEQPQTHEYIKYIEELSKEQMILTPYSAFVIPGPEGYKGFAKLVAEDSLRIEEVADLEDESENQPETFSLKNYPNPFNPATQILLNTNHPLQGDEEIHILNMLGQRVKLIQLETFTGHFQVSVPWDGKDQNGNPVQSGTYLIRYVSSTQTQTIKSVLIR